MKNLLLENSDEIVLNGLKSKLAKSTETLKSQLVQLIQIQKHIIKDIKNALHLMTTLEANIKKLTFYHIRCLLLSKDAFSPNLAEFGPVTRARATNLALNQSRIEILRVRKKLQNR